jgi:hypothetical protein
VGPFEPRECGAHHGGGAEQVHRHDPLPCLGGHGAEAAGNVDAGAGDDGVDAAALVGHPTHRLLGLLAVGEVDALVGDVVGRRTDVEHDGVVAAAGQRSGDGLAETRRTSGHDDDSGLRTGHGGPPR